MAEDTKTVVTERAEMNTDKELASVTVVALPPWKIILIRACRVYLQSLVGFLAATSIGVAGSVGAAVGTPIPLMDFWHTLLFSLSLATAPAVISLIQNTLELLAKLDATNPTWRA